MEYLRIENFKCFNEIEIPLNQLTISNEQLTI